MLPSYQYWKAFYCWSNTTTYLRLTGGQFWIGISDIILENRWIYSSDIQPVQVKDFHSGEPNGNTSANCVALWKDFHGYWADEDCHQHYNFICEKSAWVSLIFWLKTRTSKTNKQSYKIQTCFWLTLTAVHIKFIYGWRCTVWNSYVSTINTYLIYFYDVKINLNVCIL